MPKNKNMVKNPYLFHRNSLGAYLILIIGLFYGCASIQTPQGGPKDTTPPKVLKMEPKNLMTNFTAKKIVIDFDEYIKLNNEFKEFSISPEQEKAPILKGKLKRLEITLQDSLEKNTTYTLNFGKAITDINEANPIKNFTYVFSTGPTLDSLSISGRIKNAVTGEPELDAVVFILPVERDSLFGKKKPSIYTTTDSSGLYKMSNLRKGTYKIYALKEKSGDKIYQQVNDEVGFIKSPIVLDKNLDSININVFKELANSFRIVDRKLNSDGSISMNFNQNLVKPEIVITDPPAIDAGKKVQFNKGNDSVKVWLGDLSFDSVKVAIKDDGKILETIKFTRGKRDTYTRNINVVDNTDNGVLNPNHSLKLSFNLPIDKIDLTKLILLEDSIPRKGITIEKDSLDLLSYNVKYPWRKNEPYILKFEAGAVTGIFNSKNKEINKTFKLGNTDDYATLSINAIVPDTSKNYILQLVNDKKDIVIASRRILKSSTIILANYKPGSYFVRIVYDDNKNGVWDTGNVSKGLQPEKIWYASKEFSIRPNFDIKEKIEIPKE